MAGEAEVVSLVAGVVAVAVAVAVADADDVGSEVAFSVALFGG